MACGGLTSPIASAPARTARPQVAGASCVLTPEQTAGPYYIDTRLVRSDITEGKLGAPLRLNLTVVDAASCEAIPDATVEIWQCDASGVYSGVANPGARSGAVPPETFLRGGLVTDS